MERCLDLARQSIEAIDEIPEDIVQHVEHDRLPYALNLAQNRLTTVVNVDRFRYVQQLELSDNRLTTIVGIQSLPMLERLNISKNQLTRLDGMTSLSRLRVLVASENRLTNLERLPTSLISLNISNNHMSEWPSLNNLSHLESLDLSSNRLQAFPPHVALNLFPSRLRRLILSNNNIQECCGLASLGSFLVNLEMLVLDATTIAKRIVREGGSLDFMYVNLFPSIQWQPIMNQDRGGAVQRREDFVVARTIVTALQSAAQRGDEHVLYNFLLTGTIASPIPQPIAQPTPSLTKHDKIEMWKRMMEERNLNKACDNNRGPRQIEPTPSSPENPLHPSTNHRSNNDLPSPPSVPTSTELALSQQVNHLQEQITSMRKYMNVWIKREQWTRKTAAKRIQRWIRHCLAKDHLRRLVLYARERRENQYRLPYSRNCPRLKSSSVLSLRRPGVIDRAAIRIQRHFRGWLVRERVGSWRVFDNSARVIQATWRRFASQRIEALRTLQCHRISSKSPQGISLRVLSGMARLALDMTQLQRVCVAQDQAITQLQATIRRYEQQLLDVPITQLQSAWRGSRIRQQMGLSRRVYHNNTNEFDQIGTDLEAMTHMVQQAVPKRDNTLILPE